MSGIKIGNAYKQAIALEVYFLWVGDHNESKIPKQEKVDSP